jgi:2-polyprenyl-6-methoxyphenol hydroxylase-like FAD-dependent oxidoreductase
MDSSSDVHDVVIAGGGFAGAALAAILAARGYRIVVCDPHSPHPQDFRAEKLSPDQAGALGRLGLAGPVLSAATPVGALTIARLGRVVDVRPAREYGVDYAVLVETLRAQVPQAHWIRRRVEAVAFEGGLQRLALAGGQILRARLVVLATGLALSLRRSLGLERVAVRENHSLSIGFDLALEGARAADRSLTYYGERAAERIGYLTLFPIGERLRANLFVYRMPAEEWTRAFRADPEGCLHAALPGLRAMMPRFTIPSPPVPRPIHLYGPPEANRDGIVLIGDAYSTTCPAGGGGLAKALTDIERLLPRLPLWFARAGGVRAEDIAAFRDDPVKRASEANAARTAEISRAMAIDPGLYWEARRRRNYYGLRVQSWLRRLPGAGRERKAAGMM